MSKICIVSDSSINISEALAKELDIIVAPLSVIIDEKEYQDQVEMSPQALIDLLEKGTLVTTAQPNLGLLDTMMETLKQADYDHIIVFSLSGHLSGTYQAFVLAANNHELDNITILDTQTLAGPMKDVVIQAAKMVKAGHSVADILKMADTVFSMTRSYLFPHTLDQLKRGGRVSATVATLSSLLKIKPLLILENNGLTIDKFATARTEAKIFDLMIKDIQTDVENGENMKLHVLHCDGIDIAQRLEAELRKHFKDVEIEVASLPAVLAAHAGIKSVALQLSKTL